MRKGRPSLVEGRLRLDQWDDKQTGQKRSRLGVVAETVQFLGSPAGGEAAGASAPRVSRPAAPAPAAEPVEGDGPPESDDVPF
jgi:single-strand DNA-binding protein